MARSPSSGAAPFSHQRGEAAHPPYSFYFTEASCAPAEHDRKRVLARLAGRLGWQGWPDSPSGCGCCWLLLAAPGCCILLGVGRADALLKRVQEHPARRGPSGCASGARAGAFCSASAERMRLWSASWSILLGVCRADALLERVLEHSARRLPSGCASGARSGAFCSAWAERMRFWSASWRRSWVERF